MGLTSTLAGILIIFESDEKHATDMVEWCL